MSSSDTYSKDILAKIFTDKIGEEYFVKRKISWGSDGTYQDVSIVAPFPVQMVGSSAGYGTQGSISNNASVTTTASTFIAPANAIGFVLEAESGNSANIRWAIGSTATASVGTLAEPGRDTGFVPAGADISVIAISGTQSISVQWVIK